jgi:putative endonuclease
MPYYVYILYSEKLDRYYIGHTEDLVKRLADHHSGLSSYTSKAIDWHLVYSEEYADRALARNREASIKKKKSRKYIEWLVSGGG